MHATTTGQCRTLTSSWYVGFPLVRIANDDDLTDALATVDDLLTRELDAGGDVPGRIVVAVVTEYSLYECGGINEAFTKLL